jgi:hypothetical protein
MGRPFVCVGLEDEAQRESVFCCVMQRAMWFYNSLTETGSEKGCFCASKGWFGDSETHINLHSVKRKETAPADDVPCSKDPEYLEDKEECLPQQVFNLGETG